MRLLVLLVPRDSWDCDPAPESLISSWTEHEEAPSLGVDTWFDVDEMTRNKPQDRVGKTRKMHGIGHGLASACVVSL